MLTGLAEFLPYFLSVLSAVLGLILWNGFRNFVRESLTKGNPAQTDITVLVACKNEAERISGLLESLQNLNYSSGKWEVIFLDDNSADNTFDIISRFCSTRADQFRAIRVLEKSLPAKKGVLEKGIGIAKYPNIVITDADCTVPRDWLLNYAQKFAEGFDFIMGPAAYFSGRTFLSRHICWENFRNRLVTGALNGYAVYTSATAMNIGFTTELYAKIGGYAATADKTSGDDDLLLREAVRAHAKIGCIFGMETLVLGPPEKSWKKFFLQKARHVNTSHVYELKPACFLGTVYLIHFISFISLFFIPFSTLFFLPFLMKTASEYGLAMLYQKHYKYDLSITDILIHSTLTELLVPVHFLRSFFWNKSWR